MRSADHAVVASRASPSMPRPSSDGSGSQARCPRTRSFASSRCGNLCAKWSIAIGIALCVGAIGSCEGRLSRRTDEQEWTGGAARGRDALDSLRWMHRYRLEVAQFVRLRSASTRHWRYGVGPCAGAFPFALLGGERVQAFAQSSTIINSAELAARNEALPRLAGADRLPSGALDAPPGQWSAE